MEPLDLSTTQKFELERFKRDIDNTTDIKYLRKFTKQLLEAWFAQRAATTWAMKESLNSSSKFYQPQQPE